MNYRAEYCCWPVIVETDLTADSVEFSTLSAPEIIALAQRGMIDDQQVFVLANQMTSDQQRIDYYRAWLVNTPVTLVAANAWYNLGVTLLYSGHHVLSEQAFLNAGSFGPAQNALAEVDFNALTAEQDVVRQLCRSARSGAQQDYNALILGLVRLNDIGAGQEIFTILHLYLPHAPAAMAANLWFEFAVRAHTLGHVKLAHRAAQTACDLDPRFELAGLLVAALTGETTVPQDCFTGFSLFYTPLTAAKIADFGLDVVEMVLAQWMLYAMMPDRFFYCYRLGRDFEKMGRYVEARSAHDYSQTLCPEFERFVDTLPPPNSGALLAELVGNWSLTQAQAIRSGEISRPTLPSRTAPHHGPMEQAILKAPHLCRLMVRHQAAILAAQQRLTALTDPQSYAYRNQLEQMDQAAKVIVRLKAKIAALVDNAPAKGEGRAALLVAPGGVGEHIHANGAARYLATLYDTVYVAYAANMTAGAKTMYDDDPAIKWQMFARSYSNPKSFRSINGKDLYIARIEADERQSWCFVTSIYHLMDMPPTTGQDYFYIEERAEGDQLLALAQSAATEFIFCQTTASSMNCNHVATELTAQFPDTFIACPDVNPYAPGHPFYETGEAMLNKPLFWYLQLMSNAAQMHLIDSSFFALSHYIAKPDRQKAVCYVRPGTPLEYYRRAAHCFPNIKYIPL